jgi:hypothetical protein
VHFEDALVGPGEVVPVRIVAASQNSLTGVPLERTREFA